MKHAAPLGRETRRRLRAWLRAETARVRLPLAATVAGGLVSGACIVAQCWLLARLVCDAVLGHRGPAVPLLLGLLLATVLLRAAAAAASDRAAFEAGARCKRALRARLLSHVATLGPTWTRLRRVGELSATLLDATESVGRYCAAVAPQAALAVLLPFGMLVFVLPTDWVSGVILLLCAPLLPLFMVLTGLGAEAANQAQWRTLAQLGGRLFDAIEGLPTLRLFGAARAETRRIATLSEQYRRTSFAVLRIAFLSSLVLEFFATVSIAMVAVFVGFRLYYGEMHLLPGLAVLLVTPEFFRVLRGLGAQHHAGMEALAAADTIVALLDQSPPAAEPGHATLPAAIRTIALSNIGFRHGETPVLRDVTLSLRPGTLTVLVGETGAGKTTLGEILLGLRHPDTGRVEIDGHDLRGIDPDHWRRRLAWLPQRPTLFHGTLRDNLRLGRPDADDDALRAALALAGADGFVAALPLGLDTPVGERGQTLSGGEVQRVALARALLRDAALLVLDEPTSALNAAAAALVARTLQQQAAAGRAVLAISHDRVLAEHADIVLELRNGQLSPLGDATLARTAVTERAPLATVAP